MNSIQELQKDILDQTTNLSSILRKAKVLASILRNEEFKKWVDNELNGYQCNNEEMPDYRQGPAESFGYFVSPFDELKNIPIPTLHLPDQVKKFASEIILDEGVRALESLLESDSPSFSIQWPANLVAAIISDKIYVGYNCISAWKSLSRGQVEQVLDTVRNRLLDFVIELKERYPGMGESEDAISKVPKEQVSSMFRSIVIHGNHNVVASGSDIDQEVHQQIHENDLDALLRYIEMIGVPADDAKELKKAIEEDGPRTEPGKFGSKVVDWMSKMTKKAIEGTLDVAISSAPTLIEKALKALLGYYGWE